MELLKLNGQCALGSLVLLSTSESAADVLAIDGKGHLVLSLCKDTHSIFGIAGHPSRYGPKHDRYCEFTSCLHVMRMSSRYDLVPTSSVLLLDVEIDLTPDFMRAGKPGFERIRNGLRKLEIRTS